MMPQVKVPPVVQEAPYEGPPVQQQGPVDDDAPIQQAPPLQGMSKAPMPRPQPQQQPVPPQQQQAMQSPPQQGYAQQQAVPPQQQQAMQWPPQQGYPQQPAPPQPQQQAMQSPPQYGYEQQPQAPLQQPAIPTQQYQEPTQKKYNFAEKAAAMENMMRSGVQADGAVDAVTQISQAPPNAMPSGPPPAQSAPLPSAAPSAPVQSAPTATPAQAAPSQQPQDSSLSQIDQFFAATPALGSADKVWQFQPDVTGDSMSQLEQAFALPQSNDPFALHPASESPETDIEVIPGFGFADVASSVPTMSVSGQEENLSRAGYASSILDPIVASPTDAANFIKRTFQSTIGSEMELLSSDRLTFTVSHWSADGNVDPYPVAGPQPVRKPFKNGESDPFATPWEEVNLSGASFLSSQSSQLSSGLQAALSKEIPDNLKVASNPASDAGDRGEFFEDYSHMRGSTDGSSRLASLRSAKPDTPAPAISTEDSRELVRSQFRKGANRDRFGDFDSAPRKGPRTGVAVVLILVCGICAAGTFAVLNMGTISSLLSATTGSASSNAAVDPNAKVGGQWHVSMYLENGSGARSPFQEFDVIVSENGMKLTGSGTDQEGAYTIDGSFTSSNSLSFKKIYTGASRFRLPIAFSGQISQEQGGALATGHFYAHLVEGNQSLNGVFELKRGLRSQLRSMQWNS